MNPKTTVEYLVKIPNDEGTAFVDQVTIQVPAEIDQQTGETILGTEALQLIEETRVRHMGLLTPPELKALRLSLGLTQAEMAQCLQAGEKSYTRWELGYSRQSRLVNNFLLLLKSGKINLTHLCRPNTKMPWHRLQASQQAQAALPVNHSLSNRLLNAGMLNQTGYNQPTKAAPVCAQGILYDEAVAA